MDYYDLLLTTVTFTNLLLHARLLLLFNKLYCIVLYCISIFKDKAVAYTQLVAIALPVIYRHSVTSKSH